MLTPVSPTETRFYPQGALATSADGTILGVGSFKQLQRRFGNGEEHALDSGLIIPGLVDSHTHLPQYEAVAREEKGLLEWLETHIFPTEASFDDNRKARRVSRKFFGDLAKNGTTTASVFVTVHKDATEIAFEEAQKTGIRAVIGKVMMDRNSPKDLIEKTETSLRESEHLCKRWHGAGDGRLSYAFSPRFALSCSTELMAGCARLASKYDAHVQTHLAETREEVKSVRKQFPSAASYTEVYGRAGLLRPKAVFAHCIYMENEEIRLLAAAGSGVAHCPASNLFLKSGFMNVKEHVSHNERVGLGSDVGGGPELSIFRAMGLSGYSSKAEYVARRNMGIGSSSFTVGPRLAFYMATLGGAKALGLESRIGSLQKGKQADFLVVDTKTIDPLGRSPEELGGDEILSLLMYRADDRAVLQSYVQGDRVSERRA